MPINHIVTNLAYKLPPHEEALNIRFSEELLANWSWYSEHNFPASNTYSITDYAWDIRRLAESEERGRELFEPLLTAWNPSLDFDTVWYLADRKEVEDDMLILHSLASLHHQGKLFDLISSDDSLALRTELETLANQFDDWNRAEPGL